MEVMLSEQSYKADYVQDRAGKGSRLEKQEIAAQQLRAENYWALWEDMEDWREKRKEEQDELLQWSPQMVFENS